MLLICAAFSSVVYQSAAGRKAPFILVINLQVTWTLNISCQCTTFLRVVLKSVLIVVMVTATACGYLVSLGLS